ncbi:MAG: methionine gamma-lyase family protein [Clostridia bacterium]|nr:methionine gamma-lyase family protein [Clostridia bacterium]MBQ5772355.1 methionine gamma-lyase family protein [Clostridia bacterium]
MQFSERINTLAEEAERALAPHFARIDRIAYENTARVMDAFRNHRVADAMFQSSSGYGYDDRGRDTLDEIWAEVMGAEAALVRHNIVSGTHALSIGLFGILRPGDVMYSIAGKPYDTLEEVIGLSGNPGDGSLRDFGVDYAQTELSTLDGGFDFAAIRKTLERLGERVKMVFIQRSKGYLNRKTLSVAEIGEAVRFVKAIRPEVYVVVDNCYGEFVETVEPCSVGADLVIGSLIKNPGGGIAETGGYLAGTKRAVELASYRLTSVGIGAEAGATIGQNKSMYKGLFFAPHTTAQALKTAHLAAYIFEKLGYAVEPSWNEERHDIIQSVITGSADALCAFCRGIQKGSPVDSFVTPEPWDMPGYGDPVIMAAGAFTQGSSIELSADGPLREPYTAFFQGGLTYESGRIGILTAAQSMLDA